MPLHFVTRQCVLGKCDSNCGICQLSICLRWDPDRAWMAVEYLFADPKSQAGADATLRGEKHRSCLV
jgi:hypothetical protein